MRLRGTGTECAAAPTPALVPAGNRTAVHTPAQALCAATQDQHVAPESQPLYEAIAAAPVSAGDCHNCPVRLYAVVREFKARARDGSAPPASPAGWGRGRRPAYGAGGVVRPAGSKMAD